MTHNQYLTFFINDEIFALDVLNVKEIIPFGKITKIPTMQPFVLGVMNIRGMAVPIIDIANRLSLESVSNKTTKTIIIVTLELDDEKTDIGFIVSRVNQVFTIEDINLETTPSFGTKLRKDFIKNIGKIDNNFITILDIENIFNLDEISKTINCD
jgi:purine-binding chemotaxis protein CheW